MRYASGSQFLASNSKRICLVGMSGVGKTQLSNLLRTAGWYHYSVDYRIGTRYLGEEIDVEIRRLAAQVPQLAKLLAAAAIQLETRLRIDNLTALSFYIGKLGDPNQGWLSKVEFLRRQNLHAAAEQSAVRDHRTFAASAASIYGCRHFVCDTSGSFCSIVNPDDPDDPILTDLAETTTIIHIEPTDADLTRLVDTFRQSPKPIFYSQPFFASLSLEYSAETGEPVEGFDGDRFSRWAFEKLIGLRKPRYQSIGRNWGYSISAEDARRVRSATELMQFIGQAIDRHGGVAFRS